MFVAGLTVGGSTVTREVAYSTYFEETGTAIQEGVLPYPKAEVTWKFNKTTNERDQVLVDDFLDVLSLKQVTSVKLELVLQIKVPFSLRVNIRSEYYFSTSNHYYPGQPIVNSQTLQFLQEHNMTTLDPSSFPLFTREITPLEVDRGGFQDKTLYVSWEMVNKSRLFQFNHTGDLMVWFGTSAVKFSTHQAMIKEVNQSITEFDMKFDDLVSQSLNQITNYQSISYIDLFEKEIIKFHREQVISHYFAQDIIYVILAFLSAVALVLVTVEHHNSTLRLLLIRGASSYQLKGFILLMFSLGMVFSAIIFVGVTICTPPSLSFLPLHPFLPTLVFFQVILGTTAVAMVGMVLLLSGRMYRAPDEEPVAGKKYNIFRIPHYDENYSDPSPSIWFPLFSLLLVLLLITYLVLYFFETIILHSNGSSVLNKWLLIFLLAAFILYLLFYWTDLISKPTSLSSPHGWLWIPFRILKKTNNKKLLGTFVILSLFLTLQLGSAMFEYRKQNLFVDLNEAGDLYLTVPSTTTNTEVFSFLNQYDMVSSYYAVFIVPGQVSLGGEPLSSDLTVIANESTFYELRPYVPYTMHDEADWNVSFLDHEGAIIYRSFAEEAGLEKGDKFSLSLPTMGYEVEVPVTGVYEGGYYPLWTEVIFTMTLLESLVTAQYTNSSVGGTISSLNYGNAKFDGRNTRLFYLDVVQDIDVNKVRLDLIGQFGSTREFGNVVEVVEPRKWLDPSYRPLNGFLGTTVLPLVVGGAMTLLLLLFLLFSSTYIEVQSGYIHLKLLVTRGVSHKTLVGFWVSTGLLRFFFFLSCPIVLGIQLVMRMTNYKVIDGGNDVPVAWGYVPEFPLLTSSDWCLVLVSILVLLAFYGSFQLWLFRRYRIEPLLEK